MNSQNISASEENILANSIRIARERISSKLETSTHTYAPMALSEPDFLHSQSFSKGKKETAPAAQAIKVLHTKNSELEAFNQTLTKENSKLKKQINFKQKELQTLKDQIEVKEIRNEETQKKYRLVIQKIGRLEDKLKQTEHQLEKKNQSMENSKAALLNSLEQKKTNEKLLEEKVAQLNKRIDNNQKIIVELIRDLEEEKNKSSELLKQKQNFSSPPPIHDPLQKNSKSKSRETITFPVIIDEPSEEQSNSQILLSSNSKPKKTKQKSFSREFTRKIEKSHNRTSYRENSSQNHQVSSKFVSELKVLEEKNQQLYNLLKSTERKLKHQQKIKEECQAKFYSLKSVSEDLLIEIGKLPDNLQYKFKRLIVKVKKVSGDFVEGLRSSSGYHYNRPSRLSSKGSSGSRSKEKPLRMEDLNVSSRHSQYSHSHSKERLRISRNLEDSQSLRKRGKGKSIELGADKALTRKIQEKQKGILELHKQLAEETNEERRESLHKCLEDAMQDNSNLHAQLAKCRSKGSG